MENLVQNAGFEILIGENDFAVWTEIGTVVDNTTTPHNGQHAAQLGTSANGGPVSAGTISQAITGLEPGTAYTLSFWAATISIAGIVFVTLTSSSGTPLDTSVDLTTFEDTGYVMHTLNFVADDTTATLAFGSTASANVLLDDVAIVVAAICYSGESMVHTRNTITGQIADIEAKNVYSGLHEVYSVNKKEFIPVKLNIVSGPTNKFRLIKKETLGQNQPSHDFYVTPGHKIIYNGMPTKARYIPEAKRFKTNKSVPVYSICVDENEPILVNNLPVVAWGYNEWMQSTKSNITCWKNNTTNTVSLNL
jgi:hypothetical protein